MIPHNTHSATEAVDRALNTVIDPEIGRPIRELGMLKDFSIDDGGRVTVEVLLTIAGCPQRGTITADVEAALATVPGVSEVSVVLDVMTADQRTALKEKLKGSGSRRGIPFNDPASLTRIYAVASGKGGVGKSSVTVNLASAMAAQGLRVGIIDADFSGFSIPRLMGISQRPTRVDSVILPPVAHGVKVISTGMFVTGNQAVAWRGPMLHRALEQFLSDVYFGDLDTLFVDLPPGTGDVAISISQLLPGAHILVSWLELDDGRRMEVFGAGGGAKVAEGLSIALGADIELLGRVPFEPRLREGGDRGCPIVTAEAGAGTSQAAAALRTVAAELASRPRELARRSLGLTPA
jgi:ATP-binding protein involved in chromosome partitioning